MYWLQTFLFMPDLRERCKLIFYFLCSTEKIAARVLRDETSSHPRGVNKIDVLSQTVARPPTPHVVRTKSFQGDSNSLHLAAKRLTESNRFSGFHLPNEETSFSVLAHQGPHCWCNYLPRLTQAGTPWDNRKTAHWLFLAPCQTIVHCEQVNL